MKETLKILYDAREIDQRVDKLAAGIRASFPPDAEVLCVCVLKGAFMFFSDLVRRLGENTVCAFIRVSSYGDGTVSGGSVRLVGDFSENVSGKNVLIIDDIMDSGLSMEFLMRYFAERGAEKIRTACLIDKPQARVNGLKPDFSAFTLTESRFVVGYGLDRAQRFRNLPEICYFDG